MDSSTSRIVEVYSGTIFDSKVIGVKSQNGKPGEKIAELNESIKLGDIVINNRYGIYGNYLNSQKTPSSYQVVVKRML